MPWYGWVILCLGGFIAVAAISLRALRASKRGRRFLGLPVRGKLRFGRLLLGDPEVGWLAKVTLLGLVAYLALPFDIIPDFIPVVGQLDDAAVAFIVIAVLIVAIPRERFEAALDRTDAELRERAAAKAERVSPP